jgi:hypothetical protein
MRVTLLLFIISLPFLAITQDQSIKNIRSETERKIAKDNDTTQKLWRKGGIYSLTISQSSLSNWAAGGDNFSLSVNSLLSLYAFYKKDKWGWDNTFDFNLGYVNTTSLGSRKNDDRFDLLSKYGYAVTTKLSVAALFNLRSQLFKGYTFSGNTKTLASNFFAPGYILLGLGLDYKPTKNLSIFLSPITARWVIVKDTALSNKGLYGVTPGKRSNLEFGAFASINYLKEFNKFIVYKGRLDLFSNYRRNPGNIDIFMSNLLSAKLGKALTFSWSVDLIYDDDVRLFGTYKTAAATQLKSLVGIGLQFKFGN